MAEKKLPTEKKPIPEQYKGGRLLNAIIKSKNITGIGQAILIDISRFCDLGDNATFQEWVWRRREDIAEDTKFDINSIDKHIKILVEDGYINKRKGTFKGKQAANEYQLTSKIFDEYLLQLAYPNMGTHKVTGYPNMGTLAYPNMGTIHNTLKHNKDNITYVEETVRRVENTNFLSETQKRSIEIASTVFNLEGRYRKVIYTWMDGILLKYGEKAVIYFDQLAKDPNKYKPSSKNRKLIESKLESQEFWENLPDRGHL